MKLFLFLLALAGLLVHSVPGCTYDSKDGDILRVEDRQRLSLSEIVEDLRGVQVVFVGELHNSAMHHDLQNGLVLKASMLTNTMSPSSFPASPFSSPWSIWRASS
jgi:uncharacterized iron-regulated protein